MLKRAFSFRDAYSWAASKFSGLLSNTPNRNKKPLVNAVQPIKPADLRINKDEDPITTTDLQKKVVEKDQAKLKQVGKL